MEEQREVGRKRWREGRRVRMRWREGQSAKVEGVGECEREVERGREGMIERDGG